MYYYLLIENETPEKSSNYFKVTQLMSGRASMDNRFFCLPTEPECTFCFGTWTPLKSSRWGKGVFLSTFTHSPADFISIFTLICFFGDFCLFLWFSETESRFAVQIGPEPSMYCRLAIFPPQPPEYWHYRRVLPHSTHTYLKENKMKIPIKLFIVEIEEFQEN